MAAIQHGQPQMTIADLLGNPLPADLVGAESMEKIRIAWRRWLSMRVKIIDEYNRIPTRTQSALLTLMSDNYAEMLDHVYECPEAAWYLTANDDAGGGTYQVIEALRDRIDIVVKALHFNTRFLGELLARIEEGFHPEAAVPREIVFTEAEIDRAHDEIIAVRLPGPLRRRMEFFASQFEFFEGAGAQFEYMTKDTLKLSSVDFRSALAQETGKDRIGGVRDRAVGAARGGAGDGGPLRPPGAAQRNRRVRRKRTRGAAAPHRVPRLRVRVRHPAARGDFRRAPADRPAGAHHDRLGPRHLRDARREGRWPHRLEDRTGGAGRRAWGDGKGGDTR